MKLEASKNPWILMKTAFVFFCFAAVALADSPESSQEKVDMMFLSPQDQPFSFETLYGSPEAATAIEAPQRIEVYRIDPSVTLEPQPGIETILGHRILSGPIVPTGGAWNELVALLAAKDTFSDRSACVGEFGVLLRAISDRTTMDLLFCFKCSDVAIVRNDKRVATFDPFNYQDIRVGMTEASAKKFLRLFQGFFPHDQELHDVKLE